MVAVMVMVMIKIGVSVSYRVTINVVASYSPQMTLQGRDPEHDIRR